MDKELNVFVLYARNLDSRSWEEKYKKGLVPDRTPYGYHHAEVHGCKIAYSTPTDNSGIVALLDRGLRWILKFDVVHIWKNRRQIFDPKLDVIWTHTEREYLAIGLLRALTRKPCAPVIAQSVWLFDRWLSFGAIRRAFFRKLISKMQVLTFLSPLNATAARLSNLGVKVEIVPFGVSTESFPIKSPRVRAVTGREIRVLAIGNDVHRDWTTLSEALGGLSQVSLKVLSRKFPDRLVHENICVETADQAGIIAAYEWADCVVVPVVDNLHASGLTVALEAAALGVPLIISRNGGLDRYLDGDCAYFFGTGDADGLRSVVLNLPKSDYVARAAKAQQRLLEHELTTSGYAKRHVELSRQLVA
jgi:glycosyltransferase involved in cell wall biosynthesis